MDIFDKVKLNNIELKNRIVRSATGIYLSNSDGSPSDRENSIIDTISKNNVGLIIGAQAAVNKYGKATEIQNEISSDDLIPAHAKQVDIVHKNDSKIILQLGHAGAASISAVDNFPAGPSYIKSPFVDLEPRPMTVEEIKGVVNDFGDAAVRAKKAGYDGVQIHAAHGYLLSQFLNPYFNDRTDEYGGPIENRFRFVAEVIENIQSKVGKDYPLFIKFNCNVEKDDDKFLDELVYMCEKCKEYGVEAVEISGYNFTKLGRSGKHNYFIERASYIRKKVGIPVMLVGGIRSFADMKTVLDAGIDFVSICRPFICEPDLITRLMEGQEFAQCTSCSKCFYLFLKEGRHCIFHTKKD